MSEAFYWVLWGCLSSYVGTEVALDMGMTTTTDTVAYSIPTYPNTKDTRKPIECLSYGGGLDSWVMLHRSVTVLGVKPDLIIYADVGDCDDRTVPGEWQGTTMHIEQVAKPFAAAHGIPFVTLTSNFYPIERGGRSYRSLHEYAMVQKMFWGATTHLCTIVSKIERMTRYMDDHYPDQEVNVWIGFDASETTRAKRDPRGPNMQPKHKPGTAIRRSVWPLMDWGFCRCREEQYARDTGLPVPRKSACVFCPKATRKDFANLRAQLPEVFERVEEYERNAKKTKAGKTLKIAGTGDKAAWLGDYAQGIRADGTPMNRFHYKKKPCAVCGAAQRATKEAACDYLDEGDATRSASAA